MDDGGTYLPSKAQSWLWDNWTSFWGDVAGLVKRHRAALWCVYNGDLFDGGAHHGTTQTITDHPEPDAYIAERVFGVPKALGPERSFIVRGTESHVGPSASSEEAFARSIRAEKNPETGRWSWWELLLDPHGLHVHFTHHGRFGYRPWTKGSAVSALAAQIVLDHAESGDRPPDLAIRSHCHKAADSGDMHRTRVIQTPAWQLKTGYAYKKAAESLADIGGVMVIVQPDGQYEIVKRLYRPARQQPWRAA